MNFKKNINIKYNLINKINLMIFKCYNNFIKNFKYKEQKTKKSL